MAPKTWVFVARAVGAAVALAWFGLLVTGLEKCGAWSPDSAVLLVLGLAAIMGVGFAFWRPAQGGAFLLVVGLAGASFGFAAAGHNRVLAALVAGGPLILAGGLFLASARSRLT